MGNGVTSVGEIVVGFSQSKMSSRTCTHRIQLHGAPTSETGVWSDKLAGSLHKYRFILRMRQ
jgi:hypothetical protein